MKINNQSDFKIKGVTKNEDFNVRFRFEFFVYEFKKYVVSWDGKEYVNCKRLDDGSLEIIFNNPKFGLGQLKVRREYYISDEDFIDGIWNAVTVEKTGIYITDGETDDIDVENVIVPPYIKGEPGKDMKWSTMTQDEKDELINDLGEGINNSFVEAETTRNNNEELRKTSESARVTAEQGRVEAELKRGTDFDTLKSEMQTAIDEGKAATKETIAATEGLDAIVEEQNAKLTELGQYVENPEYARAYTDAEGRFLWGIKQDGSIEFAKGVPTPIKNYIVEFVISRIDNVIIPEIETLKEAHEQYLKEYESPEWARVIVDADGRVLWGVRQDGSVEFTKGIPSSIKAYIDSLDRNNDEEVERINQLVIGLLADVKVLTDTYHYVSNPEWACAIVDAEEHILMGIKSDGSYYIPNRDMYHVESNHEYIKAVVDLDGRVLFGIKNDGSCYIPKGISEEAKKGLIELTAHTSWFENIDIPEWMQVTTDSEGKILEGIDNNGKKFFPKQEMLEKYQDVEGRTEMTLDTEGKIISYRGADGVKYESKQHTEKASFGSMIISNKNANEIEEALKRNGFTTDIPIDWSKEEYVEIPIPRVCAKLNIICNKLPEYNNEEFDGFIEFIDKDGNYFKKPITALAIQGDTSKSFKFKNMSFDLADDSKVKFGTWVAQDSWHLKKYYIDVFRGQCVVAYWLAEQIYQTHEIGNRKPYEYLYENDEVLTSNGDFKKDIPTGALTHPDGFPIMLYHNGELIGLYAWCLKKHRDNYAMKKSDKKQIILDGTLNSNTIWNGYVDWSEFEIRNPKDLVDIDGNKYDGDNPKELSESNSTSKSVKDSIIRLSNAIQTIKSESTTELQRAKFKEYFNVDFLIDYFILGNYIGDFDGFGKNWIWCTWDGLIWSPTVYDKDSIFGSSAQGSCVHINIVDSVLGTGGTTPSALLWQLFKPEIVLRYKELVSKGVLSVNNVVSLLYKWIDKVGYDNLKKDIEECCVDKDGIPQTPSYRNPQVNDGWIIIGNASKSDVSTYDNDAVYNEGDTCDYCNPNDVRKWGLKFKATKTVQGVPPLSGFYSYFPTEGGYYNSPIRVRNWLIQREAYLSNIFV